MWQAFLYMLKVNKLRRLEKGLRKQTEIRKNAKLKSLKIQKHYEDVKAEVNKMKSE